MSKVENEIKYSQILDFQHKMYYNIEVKARA